MVQEWLRLEKRATGAAVAFLPGFEKVLRPPVVQIRRDPLSSAQLGNAHFSAQTLENNSNLLFG